LARLIIATHQPSDPMYLHNETPLAREARLAREADDERKAAIAVAQRRANIRAWQGKGLHVLDLVPPKPKKKRVYTKQLNSQKLRLEKEQIVHARLATYPNGVSVKELAIALDWNPVTTRSVLITLCDAGRARPEFLTRTSPDMPAVIYHFRAKPEEAIV
jgi:hypothetical protein